MKYRALGKTGMRVSEVSFGCWALGGRQWGGQDRNESVVAIDKALELGCNLFDTALSYGDGLSERVVGEAAKERKMRDDVFIATKVPPKNGRWSPPSKEPISKAFPAEWIVGCCNQSLKNLGRSYIDLLQLHTWNASWGEETEWYEALLKLKDDGKILHFGISVRAADPNEANRHIEANRVETVQVVYNILDQFPEEKLLPLAKKHGVGIIAREPLAAGGLTGKFTKDTRFPRGDWRGEERDRKWLTKMVDQVGLVSEALSNDEPLYDSALRFCLTNSMVSTIIPGIRNTNQAEMNLGASDGKPLTEKQLNALRRLWVSGKIGGLRFA